MKSLCVLFLVLACALAIGCARKTEPSAKVVAPAASPKPGQPEITVTALDRMSTMYERSAAGGYGPAASAPSDVVFKPQKDNEFVVVRMDIKAPAAMHEFKIDNAEASDAGGKNFVSIAESITLTQLDSAVKKADIPFEVPKGTQLKSLRFGDYFFDLSKLQPAS
jgi:hypothetical protein